MKDVSLEGVRPLVLVLLLLGLTAEWVGCVRRPAPSACGVDEQATVELAGLLERETYPGPPNWEDVGAGDRPLTAWLLRLSPTTPVIANVDGVPTPLPRVQLVGSSRPFERWLGRPVRARGQLQCAATLYHRTEAVLVVDGVGPQPSH